MENKGLCPGLQECLSAVQNKISSHLFSHASNPHDLNLIKGKLVIDHSPGQSGPGKSASVQVYSCTEIDPNTRKGKLSEKAKLKYEKSQKSDGTRTTTYEVKLYVEKDFGIPGAFVIENHHNHKFFLQSATFQTPGDQVINFDCRSWVYPIKMTKTSRIFFSNTSYLPRDTPKALADLRQEELKILRGDGTGERKEWDRIYDYDYYNDLGNPDKGDEHKRPVLGGSETFPYPRRGRTGRPPSKKDPLTESRPEMINLDIYVPPDERFSPNKLSEFIGNSIQATAHFILPEAKSLLEQDSSVQSFDEIKKMFSSNRSQKVDGWLSEKLHKLVPDELYKGIAHASKGDHLMFTLPQILTNNEFAWKNDEEFGRQMLAGTNPTRIRVLESFPPPVSKNGEKCLINESHIVNNLDGLTITQAMNQWRIYIVDDHDYLMPFLDRINTNTKGICAYASRILLFLKGDATLQPLVIQLSLPCFSDGEIISRLLLPASEGTEGALWQLAKTHVAANDSVYHQLISHWLHTHAVVEPFIIATRRQLSVMHPIHLLLDPHFKDTMHINALSRSILINSGGILEKTLFTGEVSMELSSELYKKWRFDEQALPTDLLKRRMALDDPDNPTGAQILFQDYPYGLDALDIWSAIRTWVTDYCSIFYKGDNSVESDEELQAWWSEIRNVGHGDKRNEEWWFKMTTLTDLQEALTILIWTASALHASVNFGQYAYAGYPPNRPTHCRNFVPEEGTTEFGEFLKDPDKYFLKMLPEKFDMTLGIALVEVLSRHTSDEEYLGQRPSSEWTDNKEVLQKFETFKKTLEEIETKIRDRNINPKLKNRWGPAKIAYKLLHPDASNENRRGGITGKGIPNSISL
ncbi:hypothetical protein LWI28_005445 [Acer negundo]|uniref:Lipoxygenase n=1 Tax=Acer negundo TaxID=4023 RepID=A0AAD5ISM3_ACENE|nr:hypothetical protein LWI28_005445 [Acer negundo]KAK4845565.1 hypothetical protein QYF36_006535 [Acer negundo]